MEKKIDITLIVLSLFAVFQSVRISGRELTPTSPGAFPLFISILLLVFSIWIYIEDNKKVESKFEGSIFSKEIIVIIILLVLYGLLLELLGFGIATFGFIFISTCYLSKGNIIKNFIISSLTLRS